MADDLDPVDVRYNELTQGTMFESQEPEAPTDPKSRYQALVNKSKDRVTMDFDPEARDPGKYISIYGRVMGREELIKHPGGKELLAITEADRKSRRGFLEAVTDFKSTDYAVLPGMENLDLGTGPLSLKVIRELPDILKRIQNKELVTDDELVIARLYQADMERKARQGAGGFVGDFVRSMPAFGTKMWLEGKAIQLVAEAVVPGFGEAAMAGSLLKDVAEIGEMTLAARKARLELKGLEEAVGYKNSLATVETLEAAAKAKDGLLIGRLGKYAGETPEAKVKAAEGIRDAFYAKRAEATSKAHNFFARGIARANNSILGTVAGKTADEVAELSKLSWYGTALRGASQASIGAIYQGTMYAGLDLLGQGIANASQGRGFLDGRAAAEKRLSAASSGDERLGRYSEVLAMGDVFRSYITLKSGEGLGNIVEGLVGRPVKSLAGLITPQKWKDYGTMLTERFGDAARMRSNVAAMGQEAVELGVKDGAAGVAKAKGVTAFGWWLMNYMAENNVDATKAWDVLRGMGYTGWKDMMLLSAEGRFVGGLYGAEGGEPGLRQAWQQFKQSPDELMGDAIAFALPSVGMLGLAHLNASLAGGRGSLERERLHSVTDYLNISDRNSGISVVEDGQGGLAIHQLKTARPDGTMPLPEATPSRNKAVDAIYTWADAYVQPRGDMKVFQRVAQGIYKLAQFVITADPSHMWSPGQQLFNSGIHEDIVRTAAKIKDEEIKSFLERKAEAAKKDPSATGVESITTAQASAEPEVMAAVKGRIGALLDDIQRSRGGLSITRAEFDRALQGTDAREVANRLANLEKDGKIIKVKLAGDHYYYSAAVDGKTNEQDTADAVSAATRRVMRDMGLHLSRVLTDDYASDVDITDGALRLVPGKAATDAEAEQSLRMSGRVYSSKDEIDFVKNEVLPRIRERARQRRFSTKQGQFMVARDGDRFRLHAVDDQAESHMKRPGNEAMTSDRFDNEEQAHGKLGALGLDPQPLEVPVYITPHQSNVAESASRLAFEHKGITGFTEENMKEYLRAKKLVEETDPKDEDLLKNRQNALRDLEKKALTALGIVNETQGARGHTVFINGKKHYKMEIGGYNFPDMIVTTLPGLGRGERSLGHVFEEFKESERRRTGKFSEDGRPLLHPVEASVFSKLADLAQRVASDPNSTKAEKVDAGKLIELFSINSPYLNVDAYSKASMLLEGWHTRSASAGEDLWASAGLSAIRRRIESSPEALEAAAALRLYSRRDVEGHYGPTNVVSKFDMPIGYAEGWLRADGTRERPMDLLNKLDPLAEESYKKIMATADAKEIEPEAAKAETARAEKARIKEEKARAKAEAAKKAEVTEVDEESPYDKEFSTVEVPHELLGYETREDFLKDYEKRPEDLKDASEEEWLKLQYCSQGLDQKAAKTEVKSEAKAEPKAKRFSIKD